MIKMIAGKIIPTLATTTAMIVGASLMEFYKFIQDEKDIEKYRNLFSNLAICTW
jgi:ubiquitin-activating enzyme E1